MPTSTETEIAEITLWLMPEQVQFANRILQRAGARCVRAGCPRKGQSVGSELGAATFDDLRAELAAPVTGLFVLLTNEGFSEGDSASEDLRALGLATTAQRPRILTLEPVPTSAGALRTAGVVPAEAMPQMMGLPRHGPALMAGTEWIESLAGVRAASIHCSAKPGEGSLAALLMRAFDLLILCMGEPESVDAAFIHPHAFRSLHAAPGDTLSGLTGTASMIARFADGRCASLFAQDDAVETELRGTMIGAKGQLTVDATACIWHGGEGGVQNAGEADEGAGIEVQMASEMAAILRGDPRAFAAAPLETMLLIAQAALLSARTGQPESPATIRMMSGIR